MFCHRFLFSAINFDVYKPVSQSCAVGKSEKFWRATGQSNLVDSMELAKVQFYEYENQNLQAFVAANHLYAKFDCPVACQDFSQLLATAHDCETWLIIFSAQNQMWIKLVFYVCLLIKTDHKASAN